MKEIPFSDFAQFHFEVFFSDTLRIYYSTINILEIVYSCVLPISPALKKSYVDVFNPSGAPAKPIEPVLAPMLPQPTIPQGGIFVPAPVPADDSAAQQQQSQEVSIHPNLELTII